MANKYNKIIQVFLIITCLVCFKCSSDNKEENDSAESNKIIESTTREIFISKDYLFEDEGLYRPLAVRFNSVTNEVIVLDCGDKCIRFFTQKGEFIRKKGGPGQGPGDFIKPFLIDTDYEGNIYIYDIVNRKISILDEIGKYITSFRLTHSITSFFVTKDKTIVANMPRRDLENGGYYFTEFDTEGNLINEIAEIPKMNDSISINIAFARGIPFVDNKGNYIIFIQYLPVVKVYSKSGELIREEIINEVPHNKQYPVPEKQTLEDGFSTPWYYFDIIHRNGKYYLFKINDPISDFILDVVVLNNDLNFEKIIQLKCDDMLIFMDEPSYLIKIEVLPDESVLVPDINNCEIFKFHRNNN